MASIKRRGNFWQARVSRYVQDGKRQYVSKSGFRTKKEAEIYANQAEIEVQKTPLQKRLEQPFYDYFDDWYTTYRKPKISEASQRAYVHTENQLKKYFNDRSISAISRKDYQDFISIYGKNHAPKTVKRLNNLIKSCVDNAVYDEVIKKNFTKNITFVANKNKIRNVENLNIKEIKKLIKYTYSKLDLTKMSYYMIFTAILTGARLSEIAGLQWGDINFTFKIISISKAYDYFHPTEFKPTKTESSIRKIRINDELVMVLKKLKKAKGGKSRDLAFAGNNGLVPSSNAVNKVLRSSLSVLNINKINYHFHSLRHAHVAYLLSQGVDIYAISKRLGHSNIGVTIEVYAYLIEESKKKNDDKIVHSLDNLFVAKTTKPNNTKQQI